MKIALFGGGFDPPHQGHVCAAEALYEKIKPDVFYIVPASQAPLKGASSATAEQRTEMCVLAFSHIPDIHVLDTEIKRGGVSYTYLTVRELRHAYPEGEIFLLIGADQAAQFEKWAEYEYILKECTVCVAKRGDKTDFPFLTGKTVFLDNLPVDVSSTALRRGEDGNIPEKVKKYIKEKGLYRLSHVEGVIAAAEMIRRDIYPDLSAEDVYKAAKYHDCTKGEDQISLMAEYGIEDTLLLASPSVIHAFTGAEKVKRLGEKEEIVNAVRYHTTGRPNMTDIEKIIFVADYIEENRHYESCVSARKEYLENEKTEKQFDKLIYKILKNTADHLMEKGAEIYPLTLETMEWYEKQAVEDACPYGS